LTADETPQGQEPSEEELRQRVEEQLRRVRVQDLLLESVAGIVNLTARRIAKEDERDLEQARIGIEAVRAVVGLLEPEPGKAVREALAELQVLYAREAQGGVQESAGSDPGPVQTPEPSGDSGSEPTGQRPPETPDRRTDPPPRLWTPPGSG
jgi:hypothetical protein